MNTLPTAGDTVYLIHEQSQIVRFTVLYVTQRPYISGTETSIPADRQTVLGENAHLGLKLLPVPALFATEREARLRLVQSLRARMDSDQRLFDDAYRDMIKDEKARDKP